MEKEFDISIVKGMTKEQRVALAAFLRKDPELYNAMNGMGGISESASYGLLQGTTYAGDEILTNVKVTVKGIDNVSRVCYSNQYGYYQMNLAAGQYNVVFEVSGVKKEDPGETVEIKNGGTTTLDYDSEYVPEPPPPPEGGGA